MATLQGGAAYFIMPDHLGAPHEIVNAANARVWFWDHDPFGNGTPTAAAGFSHDLRFPGQIYDSETRLHNNGFRDYSPTLGRYVESDPIGLAGGINTYAYAGNNPVNAIDPYGLDPKRPEPEPGLCSPCIECYLIPSLRLPSVARFAYGLYQSYRGISRTEVEISPGTSAPTGQFYSVGYEMKLNQSSYPGASRGTHFQEANESLLQAMEGDAAFAQGMQSLGVNLQRTPSGLAPRTSPSGWTWHHAEEFGVMQLVPRPQHRPGSIFQNALHPNGQGGFAIWGK